MRILPIALIVMGIGLILWLIIGQMVAQINIYGSYYDFRLIGDVSLFGFFGFIPLIAGFIYYERIDNFMIYITGDTHGDIDFQKLKNYFDNKYITEKDFLIILGDAGIVWSEKECFIWDYALLGLTVLFIDGNHENFELLDQFPVVEFKGAKCHRLYKNIFHILRGEIININGLSFFAMGGATSIDKVMRTNRISWWEEENISNKDILNGLNNLEKVNYQVDYVLSHCAPSFIVRKMFGYRTDRNTCVLEQLKSQIHYKHWYFGHYHENAKMGKFWK